MTVVFPTESSALGQLPRLAVVAVAGDWPADRDDEPGVGVDDDLVVDGVPTNPLAPKGPHRRHPKMLPDGARERLLETVNAARDRLVVTWLADGGLRIGELCGLHLVDLHLRENEAPLVPWRP